MQKPLGQILFPRTHNNDIDELEMQSDTAFFMKGIEVQWINQSSASGGNELAAKPMEGNSLYCSVSLPDGINKVIGWYYFAEAVEGYVIVWNSNLKHFIYRLRGLTGICERVFDFCTASPLPVISGPTPFAPGANNGTITGAPNSIINLTLSITGTTSQADTIFGNIDAGPNNTGTTLSVTGASPVASYQILIPASGIVNYHLLFFNQTPGAVVSMVVANVGTDDISALITDDPRDYFSEGRIDMKSLCRYLPDSSKELYKEMLLVNKKVPNLRIVIEDSIATNSFTTPFFAPKNDCCGNRCRLIKVGVPTPMDDINIVPIEPVAADSLLQNTLLSRMIKVRFKAVTGWNQTSEHGKISQPYYVNLSSCSKDANSLPHCLWLETKTPCPEITKWIIEVQTCNLRGDTGATDTTDLNPWKEYATIDLYDQTDPTLKWYNRTYKANNEEFEFFDNGKQIRFKFCNNRECKTIATSDIRDQNPAPLNSGSVAVLGKGLVYGDNENRFDPIREQDKEGFSFEVLPATGCKQKFSRIKVYAIAHNFYRGVNEPIWVWPEDLDTVFSTANKGIVGFGGLLTNLNNPPLLAIAPAVFNKEVDPFFQYGFEQRFPDGVLGFRAILAGTPHIAESVQKVWYPNTGLQTLGILGQGASSSEIFNTLRDIRNAGGIIIQEFDFGMVPNERYVCRIVGHNDTENLPKTSTFTICKQSFNVYKPAPYTVNFGDYIKEISIDTVNGNDYDGLIQDEVLIIADLTEPHPVGVLQTFPSAAIRGYLYESKESQQPIELADVIFPFAAANLTLRINSKFTDHNGFYFATNFFGGIVLVLESFNRCQQHQLLGNILPIGTYSMASSGNKRLDIYATDRFPDYITDACNRWYVEGTINECGSVAGISGVPVILGRTTPAFTNSDGKFKVVAHRNLTRGSDQLIISSGVCSVVDCNCNPINVVLTVNQPVCTNCIAVSIPVGTFNFKTIVNKGFEHGSRVPIGIVGHDWLGRHGDVNDKIGWEVQIPPEQSQGDALYPQIKVNLPVSFSPDFCSRFKFLTFWVGSNPDFSDFIEWAADEVKFIDSAGNESPNNIDKVKIMYRSLSEYNLIRGKNTNSTWNVVGADEKTVVGDIVEFIQNADNSYLPPGAIGIVQHDQQGQYFLVDYTPAFANLKDGVRFKLKRPYPCEISKPYFEYSKTIYFCGGDCKPRDYSGNVISSFMLEGFNAYMVPRQIPVVKDVTVNGVTSTTKTATVFPFQFEHHSPSDTWGDHCFSGGRIGYKNPYEGKKCDRDQMLTTGALNSANDGAINYLHYFSLEDEVLLDDVAIRAIIVRSDQQVMVICDSTTISLAYNDNRAVVTPDGYVKLPTNQRFSRPEKDEGFSFGCQPKDLNTIRRNGSIVMWLDSQKVAIVEHNFSTGKDISFGIKSWLTPAIKESLSNNNIFFHAQFDNRGDDIRYLLTRFNNKLDQYTNDEIKIDLTKNETQMYSFSAKGWQMLHYTPEYFGMMRGEQKETQFFSFKGGLAYAHHNAVNPATVFLNYFGVQCTPVIGVICNVDRVVKTFLNTEVLSHEQLFIAQEILTQMNQRSQLFEGAFDWGEGKWVAAFFGDTQFLDASDPTNTDGILHGDALYGTWMKVTFIAYNKDLVTGAGSPYDGKFFKLHGFNIFVNRR